MNKIIIYLDGGQLQSVMTNSELGELKVYVIDTDIQGIPERDLMTIQYDANFSYKALCYTGMADIDDTDMQKLTDLIDKNNER